MVDLTDFDIGAGAARAAVRHGQRRAEKVAILDLDLAALQPTVAGRSITLGGVAAKLTPGRGGTERGVRDDRAHGGLPLGMATVSATGK